MVLYNVGNEKYFDHFLLQCLKDNKNTEVSNILQRYGLDFSSLELCQLKDSSQATLLHYAAEYGNVDVTEDLLLASSDVDAQDIFGRSPLMLAVTGKQKNVIQVLLKANANINLTDSHGRNVLQIILKIESLPFLTLRTVIENTTWQKILNAISPDFLVKELDESGFTSKDALHWGNVDLLKILLSHKNDINVPEPNSGRTLLHIAIQLRKLDIANLLIKMGAEVDALDCWMATPLFYIYYKKGRTSITKKTIEILKILLSRVKLLTASTKTGNMQIWYALQFGNDELIETILQSNVDLTAKDEKGNTVLHYLAQNRNVNLFRMLEVKKSSHHHKDTEQSSFNAIKVLLHNGANVNDTNNKQETALYLILANYRRLNKKSVTILLQYGANPQKFLHYFIIFQWAQSHIRAAPVAPRLLLDNLDQTEPIIAQLAVIEGFGIGITESTRLKINRQPSWMKYFETCQQHVERMRKIKINDNVTLLRFLGESQVKTAAHVRNAELFFELRKVILGLEVDFPYTNVLKNRFNRAVQLAKLRNNAIISLCQLVEMNVNLFYGIADKIVDYLGDKNMENLHLVWGE